MNLETIGACIVKDVWTINVQSSATIERVDAGTRLQ